uniref:Uncharacterized protein LOC113796879 n=1 Tax=Dermatophagoides pteronyssinus TaxID=6956 RepID=A0A6P6YCG1_DERPT|nr:uncharacterized protein LOC113796879 [Dermatophagoides pteronyssinus]
MNGRSHILLRPIISEQLWNEFKLRMYENRFILITLTGGKKSHIMLYYCHRRVMNVLPGQNLLIFGPVSICFNDFIDINCESIFELERMRHIHLHGRGFKFRVQSNSHKLFLYPTDIIDGKINFKWIQQLPPPTPTPTPTIDNQSAADNQNQQHKISFEHELHVSSKITISTIERWIYGWYPTLRNKPIRYYHSGNEINPDVDLVSMDFNSQLQIICEFQQ